MTQAARTAVTLAVLVRPPRVRRRLGMARGDRAVAGARSTARSA